MTDIGILRAGARLAETIPTEREADSTIQRVGTIAATYDTGGYLTADVDMSGGTLRSIPMTVDCAGANPGDRCVVSTYAHLSTITGIIANPSATVGSLRWKIPYSSDLVTVSRVGNLCILQGAVKYTSAGEVNDVKASETLPHGYRPSVDGATIFLSGGRATLAAFGHTDGTLTCRGNPNNAFTNVLGVWHTADSTPGKELVKP